MTENSEQAAREHRKDVSKYMTTFDDGTYSFTETQLDAAFLAGVAHEAARHEWIPVTPETHIIKHKELQFVKQEQVMTGIYGTHSFIDDLGTYHSKSSVSHYRYIDTTPPK